LKRLLNWFRLRRLDRDLDRELAYHIDRRVNDLVESGVPEAEAMRRVRLELGGAPQIRDEVRDIWLTRWLRDGLYDLRFAARSFLRNPSFTVTAVLSLALGIGATTAIYSLIDQIVLRALPVDHPERLVLVDWNGDQLADTFGSYNLMSYPMCRDLQQQTRVFEGVFCRAAIQIALSTGGDPKSAAAELVSGSYFPILGVRPALGRLLTVEDDRVPGASPVVVLSYDFWKDQLGGAPDIVGRTVLVNRFAMTVAGVAPASFRGIDVGEIPSLWIPAVISGQAIPGFTRMLDRRMRWMQILGRLKPDVSAAEAQVGLQPWFKSVLEEDTRLAGFPNVAASKRRRFLESTLVVTPAAQGHSPLRRNLSRPLWVLLAATTVLLALACLNVAGLFLARGSARHREISTRAALGASRERIGRQLLADSVSVALVGGALGVLLAPLTVRALLAFLPQNTAANDLHAGIDMRVLVFAVLASMITGLLAGLGPALQVRKSLASSLRDRADSGVAGLSLRRAIVTIQIAFTLMLVVGAGLFVRTLSGLVAKGPGFETSSLIAFGIKPARNGYSPGEASQLVRRIYDEIRSSRSTQSVSIAEDQLLLGGVWANPLTIQNRDRFATDRDVQLNAVTPGFFATLGTRIVAGRDFDDHDSLTASEDGHRVVIVNEAFVSRYFRGRDPLGALVCMGSKIDARPDIEIVGVVENISYRNVREQWEQAYFPMGADLTGSNFYVRFQGSPESAFQSIRAVLRNADPTMPISYLRTLDEEVARSLNTERMLAVLSTSFSVLALLLSLVGLYGVMSFVVTRRTREIGIRLALGATRRSAVWLILGDALLMVVVGTAIAVPGIWALGRLVESQLYDVTPTDPVTIVASAVLLCAIALGAALVPAHRASIVNPTDALRFE
jgi:predicted permease